MSYIRYKTIKRKQYAYRQTSVRHGKKVKTISEYLGAVGGGVITAGIIGVLGVRDALGMEEPKRYAADTMTHPRGLREQEESDRNLFRTNRAAFNAKQSMDRNRQQKDREAVKEWRESKMSRAEKADRAVNQAAAKAKWEDTAQSVNEFKEAQATQPNADGKT